MTTVAWDGKTLAADRQVTYGNQRFEIKKLFVIGDGKLLMAGAGTADDLKLFASWLEDSFADNELLFGGETPEIDDLQAIVINTQTGESYLYGEKLVPIEIKAPFAIGSGGDFAMAAMKLGKSAKEAVELASEIDIFSGFGVDYVDVNK
ncbi:hypothetical protein [Chitinibacter tainanensis]|uniref:hypothetical protein n=1 Tax=Chitinibacter tainanensis TaxID=230667 RepID=UPI00048C4141|nr:hypothetical protein [Chitinibacter tainanensis]